MWHHVQNLEEQAVGHDMWCGVYDLLALAKCVSFHFCFHKHFSFSSSVETIMISEFSVVKFS